MSLEKKLAGFESAAEKKTFDEVGFPLCQASESLLDLPLTEAVPGFFSPQRPSSDVAGEKEQTTTPQFNR